MKRAYVVGAVGIVLGSMLGMVSCSEEDTTTSPGRPDTGNPGTDSVATTDGIVVDDSTPGSETSTTTDGSTGSDGGMQTQKCPAADKIKSGSLATLQTPGGPMIEGDGAKLTGVIATSRKFRLSSSPKALGDSCLYGFFVADANATFLPYSGTLVLSYGKNAVASGDSFSCPLDSDLIPGNVKPGDKFDLTAEYDLFGPTAATCSGASDPIPNPDKMRRLWKLCEITAQGTGTVPAPALIANKNDLSTGAELQKWMGGYVKIENVEATSGLDFGAFQIKDSTLLVSNDIYYRGVATQPTVSSGTKFSSISGLSYLDFCTWTLMPNSCADMIATTAGVCPGGTPTDAGTPTDTGSATDTGAAATDAATAADSPADSVASDAADGG